jgi:hypothetical protein
MNIFHDNKNTIKLYMHAGLCNQLFMIFATISYAIDNNFKYIIYSKKNVTIDNGNPVYWSTLLDRLQNNITDVIDNDIILYDEPSFHYQKIPFISQSFNIRGYYQSDKYFKHNYDKILDIIDFNKKQQEVANEYSILFKKKTIALHFRIGDYKGLQYNHPIMTPVYYENAFKYLESKIENIANEYDILYFCQKIDNEIVDDYISKLNKDRNYNFIKISDDIPDWKQLLLMSLCDNFIIGNSTFSWFGAYFSKHINKIVLYPSIWFGPALKTHDTKDICPESWIKITAA